MSEELDIQALLLAQKCRIGCLEGLIREAYDLLCQIVRETDYYLKGCDETTRDRLDDLRYDVASRELDKRL